MGYSTFIDDLIIYLGDSTLTKNKINYNLSGGQTLTYKSILED